jgi:RNA polymerase sigma factor (sigma-70 family)
VCKVSLEDAMVAAKKIDLDVVSLDDALQALAAIDARQARVVELRYFGGLSLQEIATVMEIGSATVQRDWTAARAWLHREMSRRTKT